MFRCSTSAYGHHISAVEGLQGALNIISRRWEAAIQKATWPWSLAAPDSEGQVPK